MQKIALLIFLVSIAVNIFAQNLVPNPSFEILDNCPDGPSQIVKATGWIPFTSSPDLLHECWYQSQCPNTGDAMAQIICYGNPANSNEIIGIELISPLVIGIKYYVSFRVKLHSASDVGINKIGAIFTSKEYCHALDSLTNLCDSIPIPVANWAHIVSDSIITDTSNWSIITGSLVADSSYKYIAIGHFFDRANTDTTMIDNIFSVKPYYLVDDVCVSGDSLICVDITREIINFSTNDTVIQENDCINFNITSVASYSVYQWQFPGATPNFSTDSFPASICYDSVGTFDVILVVSDSGGCADTITKNNYITVLDSSVSIQDNLGNQHLINIYPNPTNNLIHIEVNQPGKLEISIYNLLGELVYSRISYSVSNEINLSDEAPGVYLIKLKVNKEILYQKIVINP